ncbi:uncharacterized protein BJ212DRAFT_1298806 [Suillus subaureus]|uniref:Uncharacterized protein n=1 Tax=Suillus subaureus TaxID=48587 RepID=A0A9P7ECZ6_9AGAM|nr:uncharacterized protein BJ212DRAFT_1298806 [Suillus subaureus]KAG1817919.1 hypothetical protein BJ212DRAFT_1298806 [Suillus subaureus]
MFGTQLGAQDLGGEWKILSNLKSETGWGVLRILLQKTMYLRRLRLETSAGRGNEKWGLCRLNDIRDLETQALVYFKLANGSTADIAGNNPNMSETENQQIEDVA